MRRSFLAGILLAVVAFGIWCYDANHMVDTNYEENSISITLIYRVLRPAE